MSFLAVVVILTVLGLLVTGPWPDTVLGRWDRAGAAQIVDLRSPTLTQIAAVVEPLAGLWGAITASLAIIVLVLAVRGSRRPVVFVLLAVLGEVALYWATSEIVGRARPAVPDLTSGLPTGASYPSGHAAVATVVYGGLAVLVMTYRHDIWRWVVLVGVVVLVIAISLSRLYVAAHYPTDVMAGMLLGALWLTALWRYVLHDPDRDLPDRAGPRTRVQARP